MGKMRWYKRDPDAALNGMAELSLAERGAYNSIIDLLYARDGNVPDDDVMVARMIRCHWREWRTIKASLIAKGKVHITADGKLTANRVAETIKEASEHSHKQGKTAARRWQDRKNTSENNKAAMPIQPQPEPQPEKIAAAATAREEPKKVEPLIPPEATALFAEMVEIAKVGDFIPPGWNAHYPAKWLREGWKHEIIIAAVRRVLGRPGRGPPNVIAYFEDAIAEEHARHAAPLPTVKIAEAHEITIGGQNGQGRNSGHNGHAAGSKRTFATIAVDAARRASEARREWPADPV